MIARLLAPLPLAIAALACATAAGSVVSAAHAAPVAAKREAVRQFILSTGMADGKMVFLDAQGKPNPTLTAEVGDTIEITVSSGEGAEHDIVIPELNVHSKHFNGNSGPVKVRFKVTKAGSFTYICSIPGHRQIGMEGTLQVNGVESVAAAPVRALAAKKAAPAAVAPVAAKAAIQPAAADAVSVALDPAAVPKPLGIRRPQLVKYRIETVELNGRLDDGTTFNYWTFDKKVPGPMLHVKKGDTVELTLANARTSKMVHSIDLHAVTGGQGGGRDTQVAPGQSKTIRFKALNPGLYVYHCATPSVPHHISAGMYGMILVEPEEGLPEVDREFYVMQGDLYTSHAIGTKGHHEFDHGRAGDELPTYYTFNGAVGALTREHKMTAKVGETVRVFFGVGGPNKISSFHLIGEIFDTVYSEGAITSPKRDVQTTLVAPGGAAIVDFKLEVPGPYALVDHALSRAGKGLIAALEVTGPDNPAVYEALDGQNAHHAATDFQH